MSFAYMPLFTGDYQRDTPHLSMSEHGAYFKLLMFCWDQKGPAPLDERKLMGICNARSTDEIEAMRRVLKEYFVQMDDGWYNKRMQQEIERSESISHSRSEAGRRGYEAKAKNLPKKPQAIAKQLPDKCSASDGQVPLSPSPSPSLSSTPSPESADAPSGRTARAKPLARPSTVDKQVWQDFLKTRAKMKAEVTQTAIDGIEREATKAGISLEDALKVCCVRGWRSFNAGWNWKPALEQMTAEQAADEALRRLEARDGQA